MLRTSLAAMRRIASHLALGLALTACQLDLPSGGTGTSTESTGATGSMGSGSSSASGTATHPCDNKSSCDECRSCAVNVQCATQATACSQSSGCVGIDQCVTICGSDVDCKSQCVLQSPDGETTYRALIACVFCTSCPTDCAGYVKCN